MQEVKDRRVEIPSLEQLETERSRHRYQSRYRRTVRNTIAVLIVAAAVAILISMLWLPVLEIHGSSMSPTLEEDQIIVAAKGSDYETGELVAFYYGNKLLIKRVIAGPGDWVSIEKSGDVYVNGELIDEPYIKKKALGDCDQEFPLQIPDERWFLMGDNRSVSVDSRSSLMGCVSGEQIVGKIILRIWPLSDAGLV